MTAIRVLLVDDHDLVRMGFRTILESEPGIEVVGEARDGAEAVLRAAELAPDVVCMDVQMPGMDGLEATRRIVADRSAREGRQARDAPGSAATGPGVLVLTTFDRDDYLFAALDAGASGFLLKNASPEKLVDAVQVVAAGDALLAPDVTRRVIERVTTEREAARPADERLDDLTERETEVLRLLARGRSNAEIAGELWLGEATVKTHVSKVLMKLGLRDRVHAVVFAYENGVAVPGDPA
ncbi:response regulator transcription factor [Microcella daejeonensis]|uniref:Response regulator transcription factor n=1 Tax=Microcella daejeonensis TaxID=2994971 RepID=A0A9E8MP06_9MICO|nr:response regulator transcription factor [Microcella daejeonensis]WAB82231.1 response regulator transcription factor [Microcella daejeonensis]